MTVKCSLIYFLVIKTFHMHQCNIDGTEVERVNIHSKTIIKDIKLRDKSRKFREIDHWLQSLREFITLTMAEIFTVFISLTFIFSGR